MLSAKFVKIHGMKDDRWTTKDKLQQYRGVLRLHAREKKVQAANLINLKKRVSRDLKSLSENVQEYRTIINDIRSGDKRRICALFHEHRDLLLALMNQTPSEIFAGVFQDSSLKRKQLDKLFYQKKKVMKKCFDLKLEYTILSDKIDQRDVDPSDRMQQKLITCYQRSMARYNAAQSIKTTYELMLNILKKDAVYFDAVLEALRKDQNEQCKIIYKATVMGQHVTENLDDNREKYKRMDHEVWINMKERERTLKIARAQVEDVWAYSRSLVRIQAAFDKVNREKLLKTMEIRGVRKGLIERLKEIYVKTVSAVRVNGKFCTEEGLRQGCPLSATLFTVLISDIQEEMRKEIVGGIKVGSEKFWSLAYADDIALLANNEEDFRAMMKRFGKWEQRKGKKMELETSKCRGSESIQIFRYTFNKNGGCDRHIQEIVKKANIVMKHTWGIGERLFKDNLNRRIHIFNSLVVGVLSYEAELWGWEEKATLERIQDRYLRWTLGLDRYTPSYMVLEETKIEKLRVKLGRKAIKFEEGIENSAGRTILKECLKEKNSGRLKIRSVQERKQYLKRCGYSQEGLKTLKGKRANVKEILKKTDYEVQRQTQLGKIQESRYNSRYEKNEKEMRKQTKDQKKRHKDSNEMRKVRGKLLMNIRAALQNIADMLIMVEDKKSEKKESEEKEKTEKNNITGEKKPVIELQPVETDALALLEQVTQKATWLSSMSNFEMDKEKEERARDLYQSYISDYKSNLLFGQQELEPNGIFVEHEVVDPSIMSRNDIKKKSKLIVDAHLKEE
ncbi:uncharacterized protein LOC117176451 [Belonocnema kinseyi]|uniref:uncharacterized protein LOC117176451 n=1 Tax=Belonocnema kinseyi TaxID=2817044 RepID=UPI00143CCE37|nr:uncharacterized protein LOC117176451 [Belonocnema kinseyi]